MTPQKFISQYQNALASQSWEMVDTLIHENACVTFSNGSVYNAKKAIQKAFEHNFSVIKSEQYKMIKINWVKAEKQLAIYTFEYYWKGIINDALAEGNGVGTATLVNESGHWMLLAEHLGKK